MSRPSGSDLKRTWIEYADKLEAELEIYKWDSLEAALNENAKLKMLIAKLEAEKEGLRQLLYEEAWSDPAIDAALAALLEVGNGGS